MPSGSWKVATQPPQCSRSGGRTKLTPRAVSFSNATLISDVARLIITRYGSRVSPSTPECAPTLSRMSPQRNATKSGRTEWGVSSSVSR